MAGVLKRDELMPCAQPRLSGQELLAAGMRRQEHAARSIGVVGKEAPVLNQKAGLREA